MPLLPLVKALVLAGGGSRRRMAEAVKQGRVLVNGEVAVSFIQPVNTDNDRLLLVSCLGNILTKSPDLFQN